MATIPTKVLKIDESQRSTLKPELAKSAVPAESISAAKPENDQTAKETTLPAQPKVDYHALFHQNLTIPKVQKRCPKGWECGKCASCLPQMRDWMPHVNCTTCNAKNINPTFQTEVRMVYEIPRPILPEITNQQSLEQIVTQPPAQDQPQSTIPSPSITPPTVNVSNTPDLTTVYNPDTDAQETPPNDVPDPEEEQTSHKDTNGNADTNAIHDSPDPPVAVQARRDSNSRTGYACWWCSRCISFFDREGTPLYLKVCAHCRKRNLHPRPQSGSRGR